MTWTDVVLTTVEKEYKLQSTYYKYDVILYMKLYYLYHTFLTN